MDITARIEKKQRAILAALAPWFAFVFLFRTREKPLPPRMAAFALATLAKLEKATAWLLIASVYSSMPARIRSSQMERTAFCLTQLGAHGEQSRVTIAALNKRLFALGHIVLHLPPIARHLARCLQHQQFLRTLAPAGHLTHVIVLAATAPIALLITREKTGPP